MRHICLSRGLCQVSGSPISFSMAGSLGFQCGVVLLGMFVVENNFRTHLLAGVAAGLGVVERGHCRQAHTGSAQGDVHPVLRGGLGGLNRAAGGPNEFGELRPVFELKLLIFVKPAGSGGTVPYGRDITLNLGAGGGSPIRPSSTSMPKKEISDRVASFSQSSAARCSSVNRSAIQTMVTACRPAAKSSQARRRSESGDSCDQDWWLRRRARNSV